MPDLGTDWILIYVNYCLNYCPRVRIPILTFEAFEDMNKFGSPQGTNREGGHSILEGDLNENNSSNNKTW